MKKCLFTVTNDLLYDQRMIRICNTLAAAGYDVTLIGRKSRLSQPLPLQSFRQKRLYCFFRKGKAFYIEYNIRLFFHLLLTRADVLCAIDLDTILPCYCISILKRTKRVYDAHELFCEMKEIVTRPFIYKAWKAIEKYTVPQFSLGYTVSQPIAETFHTMYGVQYEVIRNMPLLEPLVMPEKKEKCILYQGAVNEGRSFETLIPAMQWIEAPLVICGDGNFMEQAKALVEKYGLQEKIIFKGRILPAELRNYTLQAWIGLTLFENKGLSNYYSLGNRFFDYIHAGIPQVCVDYPAYRDINNQYNIAVCIESLEPAIIAAAVNRLLNDEAYYRRLQDNCGQAREALNWQTESKKLIAFYQKIFGNIG